MLFKANWSKSDKCRYSGALVQQLYVDLISKLFFFICFVVLLTLLPSVLTTGPSSTTPCTAPCPWESTLLPSSGCTPPGSTGSGTISFSDFLQCLLVEP